MLLADKYDLQERLKLNLLQIEDKELNFYTQNCYTVGTQAALISGFAFSAIVEARDMDNITPWFKMSWSIVTVLSMIFELMGVVKAMQLSIMAPGLALRGPEGSMTRAVMVMRGEYKTLHRMFYAGLAFFHVSAALYIYILFEGDPYIPIPTLVLIILALVYIFIDYTFLESKLRLPKGSRGLGGSRWDSVTDPTHDSLATVVCNSVMRRGGQMRQSMRRLPHHDTAMSSNQRLPDQWEPGAAPGAEAAVVIPALPPRAYRDPRPAVRLMPRPAGSSGAPTPVETPRSPRPELRPARGANEFGLQFGAAPRAHNSKLPSPRAPPQASSPTALAVAGGPRAAQGAGVGGGRAGEADQTATARAGGSIPSGASEAGGSVAPSWQAKVVERLIETFTTPLRYLDETEPQGRAITRG